MMASPFPSLPHCQTVFFHRSLSMCHLGNTFLSLGSEKYLSTPSPRSLHWPHPTPYSAPSPAGTSHSSIATSFFKNATYHHLNSSCIFISLLSAFLLVPMQWKPCIDEHHGEQELCLVFPWAKKTGRSIKNTNELHSQGTEVLLATWSSLTRPHADLFEQRTAPHTCKGTVVLQTCVSLALGA